VDILVGDMDILKKAYTIQNIKYFLPFLLLASSLIFVNFAREDRGGGMVLGASTYHWTQTDWIGGASSGVITGTVNTYTALSNLDVSTAGELKMKIKTDWALPTWLYRIPITVNNGSGGELTDFQYYVDLNTISLIAAGKLQSNCADIRVTDSVGTSLPYWIQTSANQCNTGHTYVWTKSTLASGDNTIYVYYGNSGATTAENGNNVFDFFDDFNDGSIGASWTTNAGLGSVSESSGKLNLHCDAGVACDWWSAAAHDGPY